MHNTSLALINEEDYKPLPDSSLDNLNISSIVKSKVEEIPIYPVMDLLESGELSPVNWFEFFKKTNLDIYQVEEIIGHKLSWKLIRFIFSPDGKSLEKVNIFRDMKNGGNFIETIEDTEKIKTLENMLI